MRHTLPAVVLVAVVSIAYFAAKLAAPPTPQKVTARELIADPDAYHECVVTVRTAGFEKTDDGNLMFRRVIGQPPVIVAHLPKGSAGVPATVTGVFTAGTPHVIRAAP